MIRRKISAEIEFPEKQEETKLMVAENEDHEKLQVKIQAFENKINAESNVLSFIRRYSVGQVSKEERKNIRFNRSKSLALHTMLTKGVSSDDGEDANRGDIPASISLSEIDPLSQGSDKLLFKTDTDRLQLGDSSVSYPNIVHVDSENLPETVKENFQEETPEATANPVEYQDKLYLHLKKNLSKVKAYAMEIGKKIPVPDQCTIEGKCCVLPKPEKLQESLQINKKPKSYEMNIHPTRKQCKIKLMSTCILRTFCMEIQKQIQTENEIGHLKP
ncbi:Ventricular zone-expressed PH domain-containing protein 1 [Saguinus oedipus]|uniref:Ventricular zone-expressed PH domain-containing protein 1 n=1 Tax=Saguinus oedipus TaxID=9490 RepID=A0ABQ9U1A5_SAGOE|nr:Ventricular zone-expressed PH domain-containing protein 1 [Saguinus oedipus]